MGSRRKCSPCHTPRRHHDRRNTPLAYPIHQHRICCMSLLYAAFDSFPDCMRRHREHRKVASAVLTRLAWLYSTASAHATHNGNPHGGYGQCEYVYFFRASCSLHDNHVWPPTLAVNGVFSWVRVPNGARRKRVRLKLATRVFSAFVSNPRGAAEPRRVFSAPSAPGISGHRAPTIAEFPAQRAG